jgi:hypothetical protein
LGCSQVSGTDGKVAVMDVRAGSFTEHPTAIEAVTSFGESFILAKNILHWKMLGEGLKDNLN